jgi:predicted RNA binding protein YcfA (HicA-like mRNA interferase family)
MPKPMKVREIIRLIEKDGWYIVGTKGSHRQFKHPSKPGKVTVAGHPSDDLNLTTLKSILNQAQIKLEG